MTEKINALGTELNNCTEKDAMRVFVDAMENHAPTLIDFMSAECLLSLERTSGLEEYMSEFDLLIPSDPVILQEMGITDGRRLKQVEQQDFLRMAFRYLRKNEKRVFLITESEEEEGNTLAYLKEHQEDLLLCGKAIANEATCSNDQIINAINGQEIDCVLVLMSSPKLEEFMLKIKQKISAHVCLGMASHTLIQPKAVRDRFAKFTLKKLFQRRTKSSRN